MTLIYQSILWMLVGCIFTIATLKAAQNSPAGDNVHVEVYQFIVDNLLKNKDISAQEVCKIAIKEKSVRDGKSFAASINETEFSHIINALCIADKECFAIALYQKNGLAIGLTNTWFGNAVREFKRYPNVAIFDVRQLLGTRALNKCGFIETTKAIYLKEGYAVLSFEKPETFKGELIGFVRWISRVKLSGSDKKI